jgi:hypothetical protein
MSLLSSALAPLTNYMWAGLLALILACVGVFAYHERSVQHDKDLAANAKLAAAAAIHNADVQRLAEAQLAIAGAKHDETVSKPVSDVPDVGLCHYKPAPRPATVPAAGTVRGTGGAPAGQGQSTPVRGSDPGTLVAVGDADVARHLLEVGRDADADLALDEAEIAALIAALQGKTK